MSELDDRRQRAREAYYDRYELGDNIGGSARKAAVRECIETATRVRIDDDVMRAASEFSAAPEYDKGLYRMLAAAFRAAGFEVED
jgi:hypothetical protein